MQVFRCYDLSFSLCSATFFRNFSFDFLFTYASNIFSTPNTFPFKQAAAATPADLHALAAEQNALQADTEAELLRMKHAPKDTGIETCQAYLQEVRIEEEWDCESILSTYSTLDNHPTVIKVL